MLNVECLTHIVFSGALVLVTGDLNNGEGADFLKRTF